MKKSAVITLVFSIILLVLGIAMVGAGSYLEAPHSAYYHYGHGAFTYSMRYSIAVPGRGEALSSFGHLSFDAGLVLMVIFAIIQTGSHRDREMGKEKAKTADRIEMQKAKENAADATFHEEDKQ